MPVIAPSEKSFTNYALTILNLMNVAHDELASVFLKRMDLLPIRSCLLLSALGLSYCEPQESRV